MAKFLPSQAKVVVSATILSLVLFHNALPQSQIQSTRHKITLQCNDCSIQEVLHEVERKSGLHFIYSTNIVEVHRLMSVQMMDRSLDEALNYLGREMDLVFKRNGQHVVIKNVPKPAPVEAISRQREQAARTKVILNPEQKLSAVAGNIGYRTALFSSSVLPRVQPPVLGEVIIKKPQATFSQYFDAVRLPGLPPRYAQPLNLKNSHPGWFLSAGLMVNDYSTGVELQAGLRSVFLVYRPAWMSGGQFHGAYGMGTSLLLDHNLSINTIYTYALLSTDASYSRRMPEAITVDHLATSSKHHQLTFGLQYAITSNISIRGGLSINLAEVTRHLPDVGFRASRAVSMGSTFVSTAPNAMYSSFPNHRVIIRSYSEPPRDIQTYKTWIGWDASLSYKLNFFQRR